MKLILLLLLLIPSISSSYELDDAFYELIIRFEGISTKVYNDTGARAYKRSKGGFWKPKKGALHVGIGHLLSRSEIKSGLIKIQGVTVNLNKRRLTLTECHDLLAQDVVRYQKLVERYVTTNLSQGEYNALTSFIYNLGPKGFVSYGKSNKLLKTLNKSNCYQVYLEMQKFILFQGVPLKGLIKRRQAEGKMFIKGCYGRNN